MLYYIYKFIETVGLHRELHNRMPDNHLLGLFFSYTYQEHGGEQMAYTTKVVNQYQYELINKGVLGIGEDISKFDARIRCSCDDGWLYIIYFINPESTCPSNRYHLKVLNIYVPLSQFFMYINMLRNEKPVYAYIDRENPGNSHLRTSLEPVGEEESLEIT